MRPRKPIGRTGGQIPRKPTKAAKAKKMPSKGVRKVPRSNGRRSY
jgi:hypothetical protein